MAEPFSTEMEIEKQFGSSKDLPVKIPHGPPDFPEGGGRAWAVALGCAGILFCTFGYINSFGVYQEYYQSTFLSDHTPSAISWIGSTQVFFLFSGALFGGPLFDRFGARVIWPAVVTYVFSVMMTSLCSQFYQVVLSQGVLGGIAAGMSMAPGLAAVGQYFDKKRGAAMGIAVAGSSLGGVIFPIALNNMLYNPRLGFGWTVRILGFIMIAILLPSAASIRARLPPRADNFFLLTAFREVHYCLLVCAAFLAVIGLFTPLFYLPTYAVEHGMGTRLSLYVLAIANAASFLGRVIPGILADKLGRLNAWFAATLVTGILAICWQRITSNAELIVFAVLYGFFSGAFVSLLSVCFAQVPKSPQDIGTYLGMAMFTTSFAGLIGPPITGALVTRYASFDQAANFSGVFILVGAFLVLLSKKWTDHGVWSKF